MSDKKGIIIGTFVDKHKILSFFEFLKNKFNISVNKIYVYSISSNEKEFLVTFKTFNKDRFIEKIYGSTIMHVKNGCIFSINALNRLIETENEGNNDKPYNEIEIDWDLYKNKLIILNNGNLRINELSKIDDKCCFLR